ncbi:MAG: hypothetical protein U1E14_04780 [Geminicoccaceae bacterium]
MRNATRTVREAVAVLDDAGKLEAAVEALKAAGFPDDAISLLADRATVEGKLGHAYRRVEELEDDPEAPRASFVSSKDVIKREGLVASSVTVLPTLLAAGTVVASAGAVAAAVIGTALAGVSIGTALAHWMDQRHADWLEGQVERGGILLWVRTPDAAAEQTAIGILREHSAHDIHIHEVPVAQT